EPAKPPLPMRSNFPFQPELGIQTSKPIREALVGVAQPATRQKAGRSLTTSPLGALKVPEGTDWATVIVVFGTARALRLSQAAAAAGVGPGMTAASRPTTRTRTPKCRLIGSPLCATDRGPGLSPLSGVSLARLREDPPSREAREPAGSCGRR